MAESSYDLTVPDETAMLALGARLADSFVPSTAPLVIFLAGDLGAGKTTLVRGSLRALGVTGPIRSPTFTLLETYPLGSRVVAHLDLYRLNAPDIEALGIRELLAADHVLFVEWPERAPGALPAPDVHVYFDFADGGRRVRAVPLTRAGAALVREWFS